MRPLDNGLLDSRVKHDYDEGRTFRANNILKTNTVMMSVAEASVVIDKDSSLRSE